MVTAQSQNRPMKTAAVQMVSSPEWAHNRDTAARLVAQAAAAGAQLVALPEYFCLLGRRDTDKVALAEEPGHGPIQAFLAETARAHGIWLVGGTVPIKAARGAADEDCNAGRVLNRCLVYAPDGSTAGHYDKLHLFAYDNGRESYDEGRTLCAGGRPAVVQAGALPDGGTLRVALSICYDLRFPELYRALMTPPCDLIVVPSAFTHTTGQAHWEVLLRARAIENQCYVLAPAQGGQHANGRRTWGHSMLIDPWGVVVALLEEGEGLAIGDIDLDRLAQVRAQLPALAHRRL